jgi:E3 ubiquitin-protein ligase HECTD4
MEAVKKALRMEKGLMQGMGGEELPMDLLSLSTVNQGLGTEAMAMSALENYLLDKLIQSKDPMNLQDEAMIAMTEIFHSCFFYEQNMSPEESKLQSGLICLSRNQISINAPGNLIGVFLNCIKTAKKTFSEQVSYLLRRYGVPKLCDKEE